MSPNIWGPTTWTFIHTMADKIKDTSFHIIGPQLIHTIIQICYHLPCPECSQHATLFWNKVKIDKIHNKTDLINILFVFHNMVNKRKRLRPFKYIDLQYYQSKNIIDTYNAFYTNFNTNGNMNLINEAFHRNRMLVLLKRWLIQNITHFTHYSYSIPTTSSSTTSSTITSVPTATSITSSSDTTPTTTTPTIIPTPID